MRSAHAIAVRKGKESPAASGSAAAQAPGECLTQFDFLVPFQKHGDADLVRAIRVDGDQAYFRTYTQVFRIPIKGGTPVQVANMPGGLMDSPMWVVGDRIITQSP